MGNKWIQIAESFPGRTDNSIKNQFFSLIRKSLRTARKIINRHSNTQVINQFKPKVLAKFVQRSIEIELPEEFRAIQDEPIENIMVRDFLQSFVFQSKKELQ